MYALEKIKKELAENINKALGGDLVQPSSFVYPPNEKMGDLSLPCFEMAKTAKKYPQELAKELVAKLKENNLEVEAIGPYINFTLDKEVLAKEVFKEIDEARDNFGKNDQGAGKKIMLEFAHPNTHKAFHIGHLRNILTGEALAKIFEANGYNVIRANYQGDVGLHIAKCLWGIFIMKDEYEKMKAADVKMKAEFLGKVYAFGSQNYEEREEVKKEIIDFNKKIYEKNESIKEIYETTRQWSLDYFDNIYKRVNTKFDRFYFESEVFKRGKEIVLENLEKGVFKKSDGAVIFEGEQYGLHNRVFINSEGNPTYEAKDVGLAELQFQEYSPEKIIHLVSTEQSEYFKVIIKAIEIIMPETKGREIHMPYGWVKLKDGKMSSRLGNVVLGEWLLDEAKKEVFNIMAENNELTNKEDVAEKVSLAAVKYSILKNGIDKDIAFDMKESVSFAGNSGPYIQYTYARINSIIKKAKNQENNKTSFDANLLKEEKEKSLIIQLAKYPETVADAGEKRDPSEIAKYLFNLSKGFNDYYHAVPVLKADEDIRLARLALIDAIAQVIKNGLYLLGIEVVEEM